jgi:hypothetical protein
MKAVVSTTYDDKYLFFLPIITWCWNRLGVDIICFMPDNKSNILNAEKLDVCINALPDFGRNEWHHTFKCPEHKEATYAQCSRLYAASLEFPEDTMLIVSDVDMAVFNKPPTDYRYFNVLGVDLVPERQFPMCYVSAREQLWREYFVKGRTLQKCLDDLLGDIECESFRGNYWGKDQETLFSEMPKNGLLSTHQRARFGTQFASNRADRDDINWRSYCGPDLIDAHLWRPGYTDENFANILELLQTQYPAENFDWLRAYKNEYIKLL